MTIVPNGYHVVTPWIISKDSAGLVAFMTKVFDAKETRGSRMVGEDGKISHVDAMRR